MNVRVIDNWLRLISAVPWQDVGSSSSRVLLSGATIFSDFFASAFGREGGPRSTIDNVVLVISAPCVYTRAAPSTGIGSRDNMTLAGRVLLSHNTRRPGPPRSPGYQLSTSRRNSFEKSRASDNGKVSCPNRPDDGTPFYLQKENELQTSTECTSYRRQQQKRWQRKSLITSDPTSFSYRQQREQVAGFCCRQKPWEQPAQ